ncbi:MAG: ACT domain-containing protein [Candidatus Hydrothermarchaeales archaeon]
MDQITILVEDRPGALADICEAFGRSGVNIKAISAEGLGEAGVIRIVTGDVNTATRALGREGFNYRVAEIVSIRLPDKPGELGKVTRRLADEEINIQYIYILGREKGATDIALRVGDVENTRIVLEKYLI